MSLTSLLKPHMCSTSQLLVFLLLHSVLADHGFGDPDLPEYEREAVEIEIKYSGFIQRQEKQVESMRAKASKRLPEDIDYSTITALSMEAREKLAKVGFQVCRNRMWGTSGTRTCSLLMWLCWVGLWWCMSMTPSVHQLWGRKGKHRRGSDAAPVICAWCQQLLSDPFG